MKKYSFVTILLLSVLFLTSCGGNTEADDREWEAPRLEARRLTVFRTEGPGVTLMDATGQTTAAFTGARLREGNAVATEADSYGYITVDTDSLVKLDELSRVSVDRATVNLLSLIVEYGQILVDIQNQDPEHTLQTRVGNVSLGVRGTLFVVGLGDGGRVAVTMLEGSVITDDDTVIYAGTVAHIYDDGIERLVEVSDVIPEALDAFTLQAIWDNRERVIEAGVLDAQELDIVETLLEERALRRFFPAGDIGIYLERVVYAPGERIYITVTGVTEEMVSARAWVSVYRAGAAHNQWSAWVVLRNVGTNEISLTAPADAGDFEVRVYNDYTRWNSDEALVAVAPFRVAAGT